MRGEVIVVVQVEKGITGASPLTRSVARLRTADGAIAGTAFLVGPRTVVTCAHVVERAWGRSSGPDFTDGDAVLVEFPMLPGGPGRVPITISARVTTWCPTRDDDGGDIAVLTLESDLPPSAVPVRFATEENLWGHRCRVFGFSAGHDHGIWVSGVLRAKQAAGWVQLESDQITGYAVEAGFSGAPIWDEQLGAVVGMAVAAEVDGNLRAAYMISTDQLAQAWPELNRLIAPPCPYRALSAFQESDADVYFGREQLADTLMGEVCRRPFVALVGPSGSGKSSLVFAGLLPMICERPGWTVAKMRPAQASSGVTALAAALHPLLEPDQSETQRLAGLGDLTQVIRRGGLDDIVGSCLKVNGAGRLLLIIDQFEELLTSRRDDAATLIQLLSAALDRAEPAMTVLITLRADFLGPALQIPELAAMLRESVTAVGQMDRAQLRAVIEGPVPRGVSYEPGLPERILGEVGADAGSLALLEFALTLLWEKQQRGLLTHAAYSELGGVSGALAQYAERQFGERLAPEERERGRQLLIQLVRPAETGQPVRRVARRAELGETGWQLGQRLVAARLAVADVDATGTQTLELAHETLIGSWTRLRDWAREDATFRAWQEGLRRDIAEWDSLQRDAGALLRGMPLAEATRWLGERRDDMSATEQQFIQASLVHQGRSVRRLRMVVAALAVLALTASGLGVFAAGKVQETSRQARQAQSQYLAGQAAVSDNGMDNTGKLTGLLLSSAAYRIAAGDDAVRSLTRSATGNRYVSET